MKMHDNVANDSYRQFRVIELYGKNIYFDKDVWMNNWIYICTHVCIKQQANQIWNYSNFN